MSEKGVGIDIERHPNVGGHLRVVDRGDRLRQEPAQHHAVGAVDEHLISPSISESFDRRWVGAENIGSSRTLGESREQGVELVAESICGLPGRLILGAADLEQREMSARREPARLPLEERFAQEA